MCSRYCCVDPNYLISKFIVFKVPLNLSVTLIHTGHPQFNTVGLTNSIALIVPILVYIKKILSTKHQHNKRNPYIIPNFPGFQPCYYTKEPCSTECYLTCTHVST